MDETANLDLFLLVCRPGSSTPRSSERHCCVWTIRNVHGVCPVSSKREDVMGVWGL
jgi:hypothetical protein